MIGFLMRRLPPGGFVWLTLHELRLSRRARARRSLATAIGWLLLVAWIGIGVLGGLALREVPIHAGPLAFVVVAAASILLFTLMTTQAMLMSQATLYEAGDLDLLFSAPLDPRRVLAAKLVAIVAGIVLVYATLLLPITISLALFGHPELLGIPALLAALALFAACVGLAVTLLLARIAGPRAARTVGQIFAALSGGAIFVASQILSHGNRSTRGGIVVIFRWMRERGIGSQGAGALPGHAAFGDPLAIALVLGGGVALFVLTVVAMQTLFLSGYRAGGMKLGRTRRASSKIARHFRPTLFATIFAKEWRLLARDPALAFQIVLRLIYLLPLFYFAFQRGNGIPLAPALAFASVLIAGQVVGSFAWLAVSAEDTPDLLKVSPALKADVNHAKLMAAMAMALPLFLLLPIAIAITQTIPGALATLAITAFAGWVSGQLEVSFAVPAPRSTFRRRRSGSVLRGILQTLISMVLGGVAAVVVYLF